MLVNPVTFAYINIEIIFKFNVGQRSLFFSLKQQDISDIVPGLLCLEKKFKRKEKCYSIT